MKNDKDQNKPAGDRRLQFRIELDREMLEHQIRLHFINCLHEVAVGAAFYRPMEDCLSITKIKYGIIYKRTADDDGENHKIRITLWAHDDAKTGARIAAVCDCEPEHDDEGEIDETVAAADDVREEQTGALVDMLVAYAARMQAKAEATQ